MFFHLVHFLNDRLFIINYLSFCYSGEPVSRASRQCRKSSVDANSKTEGHHQDWLFTRKDAKADVAWGMEMGGCERAGPRNEKKKKKESVRLKEAKALRDQRDLLLRNIIKEGNGSCHVDTLAASNKLFLSGFVTSASTMEALLLINIGEGFSILWNLENAELPTQIPQLPKIIDCCSLMLKMKVRN